MKLELNLRRLGGVVKEGVKEMMKLLPLSKRVRKTEMFRRMIEVFRGYEEEMIEKFLATVVKDFSGSVSVKIARGHMEKEDVDKLLEIKEMLEKSRHCQYKESLKNQVKDLCAETERDVDYEHILDIIEENHNKIVELLENMIRDLIFTEMVRLTEKKTKLICKIYNFDSKELPDEVADLFKNGVDSVPAIGMTRSQVKKRVNKSLLEYMERFRNRRRDDMIETNNVKVWLKEAIDREGASDTEGKRFYTRIVDGYSGFIQEIALLHDENDLDTEEELRKKLEIEGSVIVNCDKNLGMSVFSLKTMREADKGLMVQLGAKEITKNKEEVLGDVYKIFYEFENNLDPNQKEHLDYVYNDDSRDD